MSKFPSVTGKRLLKSLLRKGYIRVRQKGSHVSIRDPKDQTIISVIQNTNDDLNKDILNCIKR